MDLTNKIIDTTTEIFTTMVMMEVSPLELSAFEHTTFKDSITGLIGLAGTYKGVLAVHLPKTVAFQITTNFLGIEIDELNEDVEDAIGEIANMLGGNIKGILSENGKDIDLSLPSTISGSEYDFQTNKDAEQYFIPFTTENGDFLVQLQLEK